MQTIIYHNPVTNSNIPDVVFFGDTIWMTQEQIGILYDKAPSGISQHITKIYQDRELQMTDTCVDDRIFRNPENTATTS